MRKSYKKTIALGMIMILLTGCGANKKIVGEYVGQDVGGRLTISDDETWSYQQDDYWGSGKIDWSGTYSEGKDGKFVLECEDIILYVESVSDDVLEVTSNSNNWSVEDYRRIE